jgi:hypothetical protein
MNKFESGATLGAVWEPEKPAAPPEDEPFFTKTQFIVLAVSAAVLLALIAGAYYWFVIKKRNFSDIFKRKGKDN